MLSCPHPHAVRPGPAWDDSKLRAEVADGAKGESRRIRSQRGLDLAKSHFAHLSQPAVHPSIHPPPTGIQVINSSFFLSPIWPLHSQVTGNPQPDSVFPRTLQDPLQVEPERLADVASQLCLGLGQHTPFGLGSFNFNRWSLRVSPLGTLSSSLQTAPARAGERARGRPSCASHGISTPQCAASLCLVLIVLSRGPRVRGPAGESSSCLGRCVGHPTRHNYAHLLSEVEVTECMPAGHS